MIRKCVSCGSRKDVAHFDNETSTVEHAGLTANIEGLSGWRCGVCNKVEFDARSARRHAAAEEKLVLQDRDRLGQKIRRTRRKLAPSQRAAAPVPAVVNLSRLLDKHPELLRDLN
jgi:HTH-type transcriptional regulator/antitoxin MqsA